MDTLLIRFYRINDIDVTRKMPLSYPLPNIGDVAQIQGEDGKLGDWYKVRGRAFSFLTQRDGETWPMVELNLTLPDRIEYPDFWKASK